MKNSDKIFSVKSILYFHFIGIMISSCLISTFSLADEKKKSSPTFSVTIKDATLSQAISEISNASGYKITVTGANHNKKLTADLNNVSVEEGLKRIIRLSGSPNHVIINDNKENKIEVKIFDTSGGNSAASRAESREIKPQEINLDDIEVIPPDKPGEKGVTERELKATESNKMKIDPLDIEIIPPDKPGEKGVTEKRIKSHRK